MNSNYFRQQEKHAHIYYIIFNISKHFRLFLGCVAFFVLAKSCPLSNGTTRCHTRTLPRGTRTQTGQLVPARSQETGGIVEKLNQHAINLALGNVASHLKSAASNGIPHVFRFLKKCALDAGNKVRHIKAAAFFHWVCWPSVATLLHMQKCTHWTNDLLLLLLCLDAIWQRERLPLTELERQVWLINYIKSH